MIKQITSNIYCSRYYIDLFSKIFAITNKSTVLIAVFLIAFLSLSRYLSAQSVDSIKWETDFKKACQSAQLENRLVIVHFYSDCAPCASMNANVFTDPRIAIEINRNFVAVRADMKSQALLAKHYNVTVVPTDLILNADEQVVYRRQGEIAVEKYLQFLQYLRNNYLQIHAANATHTKIISNETHAPNIATPPPISSPLPSQPDNKNTNTPADTLNNFAFINDRHQPNSTPIASNLSHHATNPQPVISASGQIDSSKNNNAAIVASPSNAGVNSTPTNAVPLAADQNVVGFTVVTNEPVNNGNPTNPSNSSNPNVNVNANNVNPNSNFANSIDDVLKVNNSPVGSVGSAVNSESVVGSGQNLISVTNNNNNNNNSNVSNNNNSPLVRNPSPVGQLSVGNVDSTGHLTVEVPLAIEGYCPVILCKKEQWISGNPAYYAMYRGQVYRFSSQEAMEEFLKTPLRFAPVAMGEDVVMMIDRNKKICGSRKYGVWYGGRVYLFSSKESLNSFVTKPEHYANIAQNYEAAFKSPLDTVQR
jgi:YHS domain-containing protein/thioredoxin-related protein